MSKKCIIVTDSHGGISKDEAEKSGVMILPMPFYFGDECCYEGVSVTREDFFRRLNAGERVSTSQPSPDSVMNIWRDALKKGDEVLYMPLSSGLSGSCDTAKMLAGEKEFEGKVYVVDNGRIATPMHRAILDALELLEEGYDAKEIRDILEASKDEMNIYIAVETLEHLKNGGRITPATAAIGNLLNIKPILNLKLGVLDSYKKCRGMKKARKEMIDVVKEEIYVKKKSAYDQENIYLMAASSANPEITQDWINEIQENFPGFDILCDDLSLGIACHTGEGALGIGYSCKPKKSSIN